MLSALHSLNGFPLRPFTKHSHPWVLLLPLSGMIYKHWWELRCFLFQTPEGSRQAWIAQTMTWDGRLKKWYPDLRAKPKVLGRELRVCFWSSDYINVPLSSSWHWLMRIIWCRDLTPGASQFVVEPPISSLALVKPMMYFPTNECFSAAGGNYC